MRSFLTMRDIEEFLGDFKMVREIYIPNPTKPGVIDIHVKSWILLSKDQLVKIKNAKPVCAIIRIHNKSLFSNRVFEIY